MINKLIISCQSPHAEGDSMNILNGNKISLSEAYNKNIVNLCYADSSYVMISDISGTKVFKKRGVEKCCVIYGHLEERDENGRRIPFCSYAEYSDNITEVFGRISEDLQKYDYSTSIKYVEPKSSDSRARMYLGIAIGVIAVLTIYFIINHVITVH